MLAAAAIPLWPTASAGADGSRSQSESTAVRSIAVGNGFACARLVDGRVKCWGENGSGQLGLGDTTDRGDGPGEMGVDLPAVNLGAGRTTVQVVAGDSNACALLDNGAVKCWGSNTYGQLGLGDVALRGDGPGEMGDNLPAVQLGSGRIATSLTVGLGSVCALLDNASVKCWGFGFNGQLGLGDTAARGDGPGEMGDNLPAVQLGSGRTAVAVSAGGGTSCAVLDNGALKCWGYNNAGQLGLGDTGNRGDGPGEMGDNLPVVNLGTGRSVVAVSAGVNANYPHVCAVLDDQTARCWGDSGFGQLGGTSLSDRGDNPGEMGDNLPAVSVGVGRSVTAVSAGNVYTCVVLDSGSVKCWGHNQFGRLGLGDTTTRGGGETGAGMGDSLPVVSLGTGRTAHSVVAGYHSSCAVLDDTTIKCWGYNDSGQLGLGDTANRGDEPGEMGDLLPPTIVLGSSIEGTVTGAGNAPIAGALVAAVSTADFSIAGGAVASSTGDVEIPVPAGDYFVFAIDPSGGHVPGFAGAPTAVAVGSNQKATSNPVLTARLGAIAGTVTRAGSGVPIANARVLAVSAATGAPESVTVANAAGQFTLTGLKPGPHLVAYVDPTGAHSPRYFPDAMGVAGASPVSVVAGTTSSADAALPVQPVVGTGSAVGGRVRECGSAAPLAGMLVVALRSSDFSFVRSATTNSTGGYALSLASGSYVLAFVDPTGRHLAEWFDDSAITDLDLADAITAPGVGDACLQPTTGAISGTAASGSGLPLGAAWVVVVGSAGVEAAATTSADGTYRIEGLPVNNYRAAVVHVPSRGFEYWLDAVDYPTAGAFPITPGGDFPIDFDVGS